MADRPRRVTALVARVPVWVRWTTAAVLGIAFLLWLVLLAPRLLVPISNQADLQDVADTAKRHELQDNRLKLQNDARTSLLQALGGVVLALGGFFTYQQLKNSREQVDVARQQARDTSEQAREQLGIALQGQVTERFTRAIDQLGHDNVDVRVGGMYALQRIVIDSPKDQAAVDEVLMVFVRGHAPWPPTGKNKEQPPENASVGTVPALGTWGADIQAALTMLGGSSLSKGRAQPLDLRSTDLRRAELPSAELQEANLSGAQLQEANLSGAQLQGVRLSQAQLQRVNLVEAQLQPADPLKRSDLSQAQLQRANLTKAQLPEAYLAGARLERAILPDAQLQKAVLIDAWLQEANLTGAQLQRADFTRAQLQNARLSQAQLQEANLSDAQLREANLIEAQLQGAQLPGADLSKARLQGARCDVKTVWPDGFNWEAEGVVQVEVSP